MPKKIDNIAIDSIPTIKPATDETSKQIEDLCKQNLEDQSTNYIQGFITSTITKVSNAIEEKIENVINLITAAYTGVVETVDKILNYDIGQLINLAINDVAEKIDSIFETFNETYKRIQENYELLKQDIQNQIEAAEAIEDCLNKNASADAKSNADFEQKLSTLSNKEIKRMSESQIYKQEYIDSIVKEKKKRYEQTLLRPNTNNIDEQNEKVLVSIGEKIDYTTDSADKLEQFKIANLT